jgi:hypothetical protein
MSKAVKTRRCPQCGTVIKSANLEALMKHMESSAICKDAIRTCESCLMKFPDDSSLLKHMSLKKGCQDTYNMGVIDPSIALEDQPVIGEKKDGILCNVAYYSSGSNKRKKLHISDDVDHPVKAGTVTNSHATYVFPHYHSKTQQPSMKYFDHGHMNKLSPSKTTCQPVLYADNNLHHQDEEYEYYAGEEAVFSVHSQSDSCDAFSVGSHVDDVLQWAITHSLVDSHVPTRKPLIRQIATALYGKEYLKKCQPRQVRVNLCTGRVAEVTMFDIHTVLIDLLCNENLMKRDNLVFGRDDFSQLGPVLVDDDVYDDVNTGQWWTETVSKMKEDYPDIADSSVLWPLILFIDGVSHGEFTNLTQEPVLMTFSAFKRDVRNQPQA